MRRLLVVSLLLVSGCAYYNGMYNTRKFTAQAEKAEREGRTIDASTAWGQVTVKAETLLARHPDSKYAPEARVLMGRAYAKLGDCQTARAALEPGVEMISDSSLQYDARLDLARCLVKLNEPGRAVSIYQELFRSAAGSEQAALRRELLLAMARSGEYREALAMAGDTDIVSTRARLVLLAGAGETARARALADTLVARGDTLAPWDSATAVAGRIDPMAATKLVDAMSRLPGVDVRRRAGWLLADAERLVPVDSSLALQRYREVIQLGGPADLVARARTEQLQARLSYVSDPSQMDSVALALEQASSAMPDDMRLQGLSAQWREFLAVRDSVDESTPQGDLRTFLAAEVARDSVLSRSLAKWFFVRVADLWPASPYAAKALLAAQLLAPSDSMLRSRVLEQYPDDPYVLALRGVDVPDLRALEDSLGRFASATVTRRSPARRTPASSPGSRPGRPTPAPAPGQRVPEVR